jgi:hypothetical protein
MILYYVSNKTGKRRVEKASSDRVKETEAQEGFIKWLDEKEMADLYKEFARMMFARIGGSK